MVIPPISTVFSAIKSKVGATIIMTAVIVVLIVVILFKNKTISHQEYQISVKDQKITELTDANNQARSAIEEYKISNFNLAIEVLKQNKAIENFAVNQQMILKSHQQEMVSVNKKYQNEISKILGQSPKPIPFDCVKDKERAVDAINAIELILGE